ncbi:hypothetical protein BV898_17815 [Hypsibius exemplaris]|uniref:Ion transport domain-containing protein n=1 Tax=Hypsibius exemplaris TaxID=2072580 RepID=A0A9X6NFS2_HYPEX|nr:hypothetical protein BV898_17815 [Hypsibius exemplaris]
MASPLKAFQHPSPKTVDHAGKEHPVHPTVTVNHHGETRHKREDHGQHGGPSPTNGEHHTAVNAHGTSPEAGTGGLHDGAGEGGGHSAGGAEHGGGHSAGGEAGHHEEGGEHEHFVAPGPGPLLDRRADPIISLQYMTFGIWGFIDPMPDPREQNFRPLHPLPAQDQLPGIGKVWLRFLIGIYLFLVMIVLMKLLVAMLVDTYERIKRSSDFEWRYGRAKLIYGLEITEGTPPPLNLVTWATNAAMKLVHKLRGRTSHSASQQSLVKVGANYVRLNKSRPSVASALSASDGMKLIHSVVLWREIVHMYKSQNKTDLKQAEDMNEVGI